MGDELSLKRVGYYLTREQHRWLKQRALDTNASGGASQVLRSIIQQQIAPPATATSAEEGA